MQILVFIILKILEISAVVFIPLGLGKIMKKLFPKFFEVGEVGEMPTYAAGFLSFFVSGFVCVVLFLLFMANWEWAATLLTKF